MNISIDYRETGKVKKQTVAFYCKEPDLKKMVKFIKLVKDNPLCYSCDDLSVIQAFFEGKPEEIRKLVKDLKKKGYNFEGEEKEDIIT